MPRRHVLIATLVAVIWGVNFVVIHVGLESFPPLLFAALRFCLVALALPFVPRPGVPIAYVVAVGVFLSAGQFGLLFVGIDQGMPAGLASLVLQLQAAFTVGLAVLFLGERPRPAQLAGGTLALVGIGIIAAGRASAIPLGALALTIGAAFSWGIGNVATRKASSPNPLGLLVYSSLIPPLPLLTLSLLTERGQPVEIGAGGLLALLYVVVLSTLLGFGVWAWLLSQHPASTVAPFTLLVPVVGILSAWLLLSEVPSAAELGGAAVVLAGLALTVGLTGPRARHARLARRMRRLPRRHRRSLRGSDRCATASRRRRLPRGRRRLPQRRRGSRARSTRRSACTRRSPARTVIGASHEGRELWAVKISDNVGADEGEPEVLLTAGQHAREHLTIEMALYLIGELTSRYATDPRIRGIVDSREIWIVPNVNPDGSEYDISEDRYHAWRKNRQPNPVLGLRRHRPQPQLGLQVGLLRRLERPVRDRDLPRRVRRSRRPRPRPCATSSPAA